ncbi:hypothetical protein T4D_5425 [Trichinella pseudospiralis]|uniref:Uncharacterized protein n=1 Tax=Trichinella pseudospiralis TaxID=6337 RepID=A0A0V1G1X3_TRIPS|nr:hypothetical protein T4D_5425 [Trichinella pseudospiralis]
MVQTLPFVIFELRNLTLNKVKPNVMKMINQIQQKTTTVKNTQEYDIIQNTTVNNIDTVKTNQKTKKTRHYNTVSSHPSRYVRSDVATIVRFPRIFCALSHTSKQLPDGLKGYYRPSTDLHVKDLSHVKGLYGAFSLRNMLI